MLRLRDLNTALVLLWWAQERSAHGRDIDNVIRNARGHYVDREDLTPPKVRRFIRQALRHRGLLPGNRAPTPRDYERIKHLIIDTWYDQPII